MCHHNTDATQAGEEMNAEEQIKKLGEENNNLREQIKKLYEYNTGLTSQYSQTLSLIDDAIFNLEAVRNSRKLDKILDYEKTSSNSV